MKNPLVKMAVLGFVSGLILGFGLKYFCSPIMILAIGIVFGIGIGSIKEYHFQLKYDFGGVLMFVGVLAMGLIEGFFFNIVFGITLSFIYGWRMFAIEAAFWLILYLIYTGTCLTFMLRENFDPKTDS